MCDETTIYEVVVDDDGSKERKIKISSFFHSPLYTRASTRNTDDENAERGGGTAAALERKTVLLVQGRLVFPPVFQIHLLII